MLHTTSKNARGVAPGERKLKCCGESSMMTLPCEIINESGVISPIHDGHN
jgi:hypothetical protein